MEPITTITFFKYNSRTSKIWAFLMMAVAPVFLSGIKGQKFCKLMGSGRENFNPWPDWSVYALVQVWDTEKDATAFFISHRLMRMYRNRSRDLVTLYLKTLKSKGCWSGKMPFKTNTAIDPDNPYLAIITRATIRTRYFKRFWKYVPHSQVDLKGNKDLIYTKGIGEVPLRNMATFSLWQNKEALQRFAYQNTAHKQAIHLTKKYNWYKEELFARFQPYKAVGNWEGISDLPFLEST